MVDVTDQEQAVIEKVETETPQPSATGEQKTTDTNVDKGNLKPTDVADKSGVELDNLKRALKQERETIKSLRRQAAQDKGRSGLAGYGEEKDLEQVMSHPFVQDLLLKQAEGELKDGVKEILTQYPQIPKSVANAIIRNPRGYVKTGTTDVQNALLDIADYLEEIAPEFESNSAPRPKTVPIAGNNAVDKETNKDVDMQKILDTPPEEWTPEQEKAVSDYIKNK